MEFELGLWGGGGITIFRSWLWLDNVTWRVSYSSDVHFEDTIHF